MDPVAELIRAFDDVNDVCNIHIPWLSEQIPQIKNCFVFIQKHVISARDLLEYYMRNWLPIEIGLKMKEYVERLMLVVRAAFIFSLSSVEFSMKTIIKKSRTGPLKKWYVEKKDRYEKSGRKFEIHLWDIVEESRHLGIIDEGQRVSWLSMNKLRNVIMHNNAIVEEDTVLQIGDIVIKTGEGEMVSYPIIERIRIIMVLVMLTRLWIENYLKSIRS